MARGPIAFSDANFCAIASSEKYGLRIVLECSAMVSRCLSSSQHPAPC